MPTKEEIEKIENVILVNTEAEFDIDVRNKRRENEEFERNQAMYDLVPDQPEEQWMANTVIPEFWTEVTVQTGLEMKQEFTRRDFVEIYHESKDDKHRLAGEARKELYNRVLNKRHLHYFQKRAKASGLKNIHGNVYGRAKWERKTIATTKMEREIIPLPNPIPGGQQEVVVEMEVPGEDQVIFDRFNLDILDPRNVFESPESAFTMTDKQRVSVQFNTNIGEMRDDEELMGYFNLDKVEEALKGMEGGKTDVETGTEQDDKPDEYVFTALKTFKGVEIHLDAWVISDGEGIKPGIDIKGIPLKNAVLEKIIKAFVVVNEKKILVRYQRYPFRTPIGDPYNPIFKGKCYIHPIKDDGIGDGKASYSLEMARNGMFNLGQNRVLIATLPALKAGTNSAQEFRKTWNFEPNAIFEAFDINDIGEFKISDDITGVGNIINILDTSQRASSASFPTVGGDLPLASQTASASVISENRSDTRSFYKGMTFNFTFNEELYDRIGWMYWQFALPETAEKDIGKDKIFDYNPFLDHTYKTVTASLETESSTAAKIAILDNMFLQNQQIPNKNTLRLLNAINIRKWELLGDEYEALADMLFDEEEEFVPSGGQGSLPAPAGGGASNQTGTPISPQEAGARGATRQN